MLLSPHISQNPFMIKNKISDKRIIKGTKNWGNLNKTELSKGDRLG